MIIEPCITSGEKSASAVICAAPALLVAIDLLPPSEGSATLKIYDNASAASGTIIFEATVASGGSSITTNLTMPRLAIKGLYASLTGTTTYIVGFVRSA